MKKIIYLAFISLLCSFKLAAQDKLYIHLSDRSVMGAPLLQMDSIQFSDDGTNTYLNMQDGVHELYTALIDSLSFGNDSEKIRINYTGTSAEVINPLAYEGVTITTAQGDVTVNATTDREIEYILTGTATDGSFKIYSEKKFILTLDGVELTNSDGPAINIQSGKKVSVNLADGMVNILTDGKKYTTVEGEDMKATLFSEGQLIFSGEGTLDVRGNKKHGICSDDYIEIKSGNFILKNIASDGIHANDYIKIDGGKLDIEAGGDGIDGDAGTIEINGGEISINVTADATKGIKCDGTITVNGGNIQIQTSGNVTVEENDPSYCTGIKCDGIFTLNDGTINIKSTGTAGKGISVDQDIAINGGTIEILTSGNGGTYTNTENQKDSYSATCIKSDGNIIILNGTITATSTGTAGKGISADGTLTIGGDAHSPIINVSTSGKKFLVSGSGMNADYANPKAIKSEGDLTVNNGVLTLRTTQDGGEGLESKNILTINGGEIDAQTYDDAINAAKSIVINGGKIYCYSSGNDGIDSNGTLTINGGIVIASGTTSPEEGFDCDQNTFKITGGILIGTGGSSSTPTASVCTQHSLLYGGTGTSGQLFHIQDANGQDIITYQIPRPYSQMTLLFSSGALAGNTGYTIYTGGTVSGGTEFHGYYTGATYTGGTATNTFTTNSMVTTVGNSGGGPGGGGGGRP